MYKSNSEVLLFCNMSTDFNELLRIALILKEKSAYQPVFLLNSDKEEVIEKSRFHCKNNNIQLYLFSNNVKVFSSPAVFKINEFKKNNLDKKNKNILIKLSILKRKIFGNINTKSFTFFIIFIRDMIVGLASHIRLMRRYNFFIRLIKPDILIIGEDGVKNLEITGLFKKMGKKILIVPYEYSTLKQIYDSVFYRYPYLKIDNIFFHIIAFFCKKWVNTIYGEKYFRMAPANFVLLEAFGIAPVLPWTVHGGNADYIAVENEHMKNHYLNCGIKPSKLKYTGALSDDELYKNLQRTDEIRATLKNEHGCVLDKPLILCSFPPDGISKTNNCEFINYEEVLNFWLKELTCLNLNIVFQLHPAIPVSQYCLFKEHQTKISRRNIAELIPACDLFITSISSVIRMAIACCKPVLNYDVYNTFLPDYEICKGVITVNSSKDFSKELSKLTEFGDYFNSIKNKQQKMSSAFGTLDGKAGERMLKLIGSMIN